MQMLYHWDRTGNFLDSMYQGLLLKDGGVLRNGDVRH